MPRFGMLVREVSCPGCRRAVMLTDRVTARVLVIEADQAARDALCNVLTLAGHTIAEATDGEGGFRAYQSQPADVVLFNMSLPGVDGIEYVRQLLKAFPGVRVVAISGQRRFGAPDPLAAARGIGATQVLRKPFTAPELLRAVEDCVRVNQPAPGRPSGGFRGGSGSFRLK